MKNWLIKKLGGFLKEDLELIILINETSSSEKRRELLHKLFGRDY